MTFANVGTLGSVTGKRDLLVEALTRRNADLEAAGCLLYEVGVNDEQPDTVFVAELWTSAEAHRRSLRLESVQAAILAARPLLSGEMGRFPVRGSRFTAQRLTLPPGGGLCAHAALRDALRVGRPAAERGAGQVP